MLMTIAPGMLLTIISVTFNAIIIALAAAGLMSTGVMVASSVSSICFCLMNYMVFMFMFGVLTTFVEWDSIHSTTGKKIRYMFTFRSSCSPMFRFRSPLWSARSSGSRSSMHRQGAGGARERVIESKQPQVSAAVFLPFADV